MRRREMEFIFRRIEKPNKYEFLMKVEGADEFTSVDFTLVDREIIAFSLYLQLTGKAIINDEIVGEPLPVDEYIEKLLHPDK